jgi:translation initiation factor eIF-2B subunit beta
VALEQSVGNIVRKVLKLIRDEYAAVAGPIPQSGTSTPHLPTGLSRQPSSSVANFVLLGHPRHQGSSLLLAERSGNSTPVSAEGQLLADESNRKASSIKPALIDAIQEVIDELETVYESVAKNARDHIHSEFSSLTSDG